MGIDLSWALNAAGGIREDSFSTIAAICSNHEVCGVMRRWDGHPSQVADLGIAPLLVQAFVSPQDRRDRIVSEVTPRFLKRRRHTRRAVPSDVATWANLLSRSHEGRRLLEQSVVSIEAAWPPQSEVAAGLFRGRQTPLRTVRGARSPDVYVVADVIAPTSQVSRLVRFHDAIPELFPGFVGPYHAQVHANALLQAEREGSLVAVSESSLQQFKQVFGRTPRIAAVIPNVVESPRDSAPQLSLEEMHTLATYAMGGESVRAITLEVLAAIADAPCALVVAPFEPKKDLRTCLQGFMEAQTMRAGAKIILVAHDGWGSDTGRREASIVQSLGLGAVLQDVPGTLLERLLAVADVVVSTSIVEGFGRPPVEGLASGARVVASDISAHREVLGEHADFFSVGDIKALTAQLARLLGDKVTDEERKQRKEMSRSWLERYSAQAIAREWRALLTHG